MDTPRHASPLALSKPLHQYPPGQPQHRHPRHVILQPLRRPHRLRINHNCQPPCQLPRRPRALRLPPSRPLSAGPSRAPGHSRHRHRHPGNFLRVYLFTYPQPTTTFIHHQPGRCNPHAGTSYIECWRDPAHDGHGAAGGASCWGGMSS